MIKKELRKLRTLNATPQMIEKAKQNKESGRFVKNGYIKNYKRKYATFMRCQQLGPYIKVAIFIPEKLAKGIKEPQFELFINEKGNEWITRTWKNGKEVWSTAMLDNLDYEAHTKDHEWTYLYYSKERAWINREGKQTIKRRLKTEDGGYEGIKEWQKRVKIEKQEEKERRITKPWDDMMKRIPELPRGFTRWVEKEAISQNFLFYEYKKEGVTEGYCSHCDNVVKISAPKHNKKGKCSKCKKEIIYKTTGKIKRLATPQEECQIIQKVKDGFVIRCFSIYKSYVRRNYKEPYIRINEHRRIIYFTDGTKRTFNYELYKQKEMRWVETNDCSYWWRKNDKVYKRNITALEKTVLKHSALPIMIRNDETIDCERYLYEEKGNTTIEPLVKIGMFNMAKEMMKCGYRINLLNEEATELAKILKIDKARLKRLKNMGAGICGLEWMQLEKKKNTIWPDEMHSYFDKNSIAVDNLEFIAKKMKYVQIYNYLKKQRELSGESPKQLITTWTDYLNMAKKLKMQTENEMVYKPKNLREKHMELVMLLQKKSMEEQAAAVRKKFEHVDEVCTTLGKYEYEDEKFCVMAPSGIIDIIKEGVALQHCIHTCDRYFDRINRRETYLLFLRKKEQKEVPWYTLEVEPGGNIRQKRTTGDNQNEDFEMAIPFLKKWQKEVSRRLSKEEKELAKKSNQLRIEGYKQLRKDGNRIWHGKLQGKLLVDVLEEDFMEVTE